jgi:hypothetical protein
MFFTFVPALMGLGAPFTGKSLSQNNSVAILQDIAIGIFDDQNIGR